MIKIWEHCFEEIKKLCSTRALLNKKCQAEDCDREVGHYKYCSYECSVYGESQSEKIKELEKRLSVLENNQQKNNDDFDSYSCTFGLKEKSFYESYMFCKKGDDGYTVINEQKGNWTLRNDGTIVDTQEQIEYEEVCPIGADFYFKDETQIYDYIAKVDKYKPIFNGNSPLSDCPEYKQLSKLPNNALGFNGSGFILYVPEKTNYLTLC